MSQAITGPTLKQLCVSQILSSGSESTFDDYGKSFFEGSVLCKLWCDLKSAFPQGVLCLQNEMCKIERTYQDGNGQFPANLKISAFFRDLTKQFSDKFVEAGLKLNGLIPVYCQEYSQLQEILTKKWEDEALEVLWKKCILPQLGDLAPQLATLDEVRNWLKDLANAHQLMGITRLNLMNCGIKVIPPEIGHCTELSWLRLDGNQITYLPEGIFQDCKQLSRVTLDRNKISSLPGTLFKGCAQLSWLHLMGNRITSLPESLFENCANLENLVLARNLITILPKALFAKCTRLQSLSLSFNQIASFPETIFVNCTSLKYVRMQANPLFCITFSMQCKEDFNPSPNEICYKTALFNSYNCLSKLSSFVKLLSFGTENSAKIKDAFAQLERRDQCLIIEMVNSVSGIASEDPEEAEQHVFDDMNLFCRAVRKAISEKFKRIPEKDQNKVHEELFHLGKLEMMGDMEFMRDNDHVFDSLLDPQLDPESKSFFINVLGFSYKDHNVLLLIDAMDHAGF